tara:strand:- start:126037 stop:127746 length:1710 start_codon:yes stop_codon:yes gene_type:complete
VTILRRTAAGTFLALLIGASLPVKDLRAEEPSGERLEQDTRFLGTYMHRIQFDIGIGYAIGKQNLMTETGPAWLINSAINSGSTGQSPALPLGEGQENNYFPIRTKLHYSYGDRFDVNYYRSNVVRKFSRDTSPSVLFAFPGNDTYATSLFEGTRLLRYHYDSRLYEFGYFHRWLKNLRAGPVIGYQSVHESLTATYGSYTLRNGTASSNPLLTTWANAGDVKLNYHLNGWVWGLGLKWDVLDYLRIKYNIYFMERSGTFEAAGPQLVNFRDRNNVETLGLAGIYQSGRATDTGMMHRLEAEFRYCRLSATVGMEREDWTRTYDDFYGFQDGPLTDISQKSSNLGIGERVTESEGYRTEFYVKVGMAFHLGEEGTRPTVTEPTRREPEPEVEEQPEEPEASPDEIGEALDKLYDTVKDEFGRQGIALEELENSFRALGFKMEKVKDEETGYTKEIVASIDGDLSFDTGSAKLTQKALQLIDQVAQGLVDNPNTQAKVHGHTDSVGAYRSNKILSLRRAEAVKNAMIQRKGIAPERIIEVQGFADDRKLVDTMGPEAKNRRVEIRILFKK